MTPRLLLFEVRPRAESRRLPAIGVLCAVVLLLRTTAASAGAPDPRRPQDKPAAAPVTGAQRLGRPADQRIREGTELVSQAGYFAITGDRVTFFTADGRGRFVGLENLNLDRIAQTITRNPTRLRWQVTGTITEYRGANFLLVRRAVLASGRTPPGKGPFPKSAAIAGQSRTEPPSKPALRGKPKAPSRGE